MTRARDQIAHWPYGLQAAHLAWVALFVSVLNWRLRNVVAGQSVGDLWDYARVALTLLALALSGYSLLRNGRRVAGAASAPLLLLFAYGLAALFSSVFVEATAAFYAMWKAIELLAVVTAMLAVLSARDPGNAVRAAYVLTIGMLGTLITVYVLEALLLPASAFQSARGLLPISMSGVMPVTQQNALGFYGAVVALAAGAAMTRTPGRGHRQLLWAVLLMASAVVVLSQSRTSTVGLVLAGMIFAWFYGVSGRFWTWLAVTASLLVAVGAGGLLIDFLQRGQNETQLLSLSGRTMAWRAAWELFTDSPLVGHGFVAAARTEILARSGGQMSTLHGALFDVLVGVGLVGFLPWFLAIVLTCRRMLQLVRTRVVESCTRVARSWHAEMLAMLSLVLVRASTSSGLALHDPTLMLFLCLLAYAYGGDIGGRRRASRSKAGRRGQARGSAVRRR